MKRLFYLAILFAFFEGNTQTKYKDLGTLYRLSSTYNMFPDSLRNVEPRIYNGKIYNATNHYHDSSFLVFIPKHFKKNKLYKQVVYFHGWNNNVDSALQQFNLIDQFYASNINGILILPEGPKNAPDSYAGKFEQENIFLLFMQDVKKQLVQLNATKINKEQPICLAGHSGAYRAIAKILNKNNLSNKVSGIFLFDALYAEESTFMKFIVENKKAKVFCVYTNYGGTLQNCKQFMQKLDSAKFKYLHTSEDNYTNEDLFKNNTLIIHSNKTHNEVVTSNNNFTRFLKALN